jgi:hypothetical protein
MDLWCLLRSTELPPDTARANERDADEPDPDGAVRSTQSTMPNDHVETGDHGTCSLPRHTIRERID